VSVGGAASASFIYDGDDKRVKATFSSRTTVYPSASSGQAWVASPS
jgi:hypothetical protein